MKKLNAEIQNAISKHLPDQICDALQQRLHELADLEHKCDGMTIEIEQLHDQMKELVDVREDLMAQIRQFKIREKDLIAKENKVKAMIEENNIERLKLGMERTHCAEKVNLMREILELTKGTK